MPPPSLFLFTDASLAGWGAHLLDSTAVGVWSWEEKKLHSNILEMKVVHLALEAFLDTVAGELLILMSDNTTVVAYLEKKGAQCQRHCVIWNRRSSFGRRFTPLTLFMRYIPGKKNVLPDKFSHPHQVFPRSGLFFPGCLN